MYMYIYDMVYLTAIG